MIGRSLFTKGVLVLLASFSMAGSATAQQTPKRDPNPLAVAASVVGLVSIQPADNTYVSANAPYLDQGLGGIGFGAEGGLNLFVAPKFVVAGEISTASLSATQKGRLVGGSAEGALRDTFVSGLVGFSTESHSVIVLAGISWLAASPSLNGVAVNDPDGAHAALTIGFEAARSVAPRAAIIASVRYFDAPRTDRLAQLGIGSQIIRAGVGARLRLN